MLSWFLGWSMLSSKECFVLSGSFIFLAVCFPRSSWNLTSIKLFFDFLVLPPKTSDLPKKATLHRIPLKGRDIRTRSGRIPLNEVHSMECFTEQDFCWYKTDPPGQTETLFVHRHTWAVAPNTLGPYSNLKIMCMAATIGIFCFLSHSSGDFTKKPIGTAMIPTGMDFGVDFSMNRFKLAPWVDSVSFVVLIDFTPRNAFMRTGGKLARAQLNASVCLLFRTQQRWIWVSSSHSYATITSPSPGTHQRSRISRFVAQWLADHLLWLF